MRRSLTRRPRSPDAKPGSSTSVSFNVSRTRRHSLAIELDSRDIQGEFRC
jgi:hypothetical protein